MVLDTFIIAFCFTLPWLVLGYIFTISDMKTSYEDWLKPEDEE